MNFFFKKPAQEYKEKGNSLFQQQRYTEAIAEYTKAIKSDDSSAVFYTNRALCHLRLKSYSDAIADCKSALALDQKSFKAYYYAGQAYHALKDLSLALDFLKQAYTHVQRGSEFGQEIWKLYRSVSRQIWDNKQKWDASQMSRMKEQMTESLTVAMKHELGKPGISSSKAAEIRAEYNRIFAQLEQKCQVPNPPTFIDAPDWTCCKISMDYMLDPVITPSGITYERENIMEHLRRNGEFDPVTREKLIPAQLKPNKSLQEAIITFLDENPFMYQP